MKVFASSLLALLALAPIASAEGGLKGSSSEALKRRLDDGLGIGDLCIICDACDIASDVSEDLCNPGAIADFGCGICDFFNDDEGEDAADDGGGGIFGDFCFSKVATVQVLGKGSVAMKDLKVGDSVLTSGQEYQKVYGFAHNNPEKVAEFVKISSEGRKNPLEMTASHMVFVDGKSSPVRADSIKVGDVLQGENPAAVTKIGKVIRNGIYAPLTLGGNVVVDGVVASSYIALEKDSSESLISHHNLIHIALSPYRLACNGVSSNLCSESFNNADGMPYYVEFGLGLLHWAMELNIMLQGLVLAGIVGVTGAFFVLETLFGATTAPLALFTLGGMYCVMKRNRASISSSKVKSV